ncbi:unnamed protein product [Pleuronectes platessa]|uniref:Uncharacterized protein n=1 Tax=Pleuronectes platessa TaxID=8262 RepID=A0A9N7U7G0_PLEPL|nr:unnamed protein product [Pleuronectes platessa]
MPRLTLLTPPWTTESPTELAGSRHGGGLQETALARGHHPQLTSPKAERRAGLGSDRPTRSRPLTPPTQPLPFDHINPAQSCRPTGKEMEGVGAGQGVQQQCGETRDLPHYML